MSHPPDPSNEGPTSPAPPPLPPPILDIDPIVDSTSEFSPRLPDEPARPIGLYILGLAVLTSYVLFPLLAGVIGGERPPTEGPLLAPDLSSAVRQLTSGGIVFIAVFLIAWLLVRPSRRALYLEKPVSIATFALGFLWSIALRMGVAGVLLIFLLVFQIFQPSGTFEPPAALRPKVENLLDPQALSDPLYLIFMLTAVSFLFAGLREELWRAAMIAFLIPLLQRRIGTRPAEWTAMCLVAVIFGLAHMPQGWGGVFLTGLLGLGLGSILIGRRSLAEATLAHGFFDATSFALLAVLANQSFLERFGFDPNLLDQMLGR